MRTVPQVCVILTQSSLQNNMHFLHGAKVVLRSRWKTSNALSFYPLLNSAILQSAWWGMGGIILVNRETCTHPSSRMIQYAKHLTHVTQRWWKKNIQSDTVLFHTIYQSTYKKITYNLSIYIWRQTIKTSLCNYFKLQQQINFWKLLLVGNLLFFLERAWIAFLLKFVLLRPVDNIRQNTVFQNTQNRGSVLNPTVWVCVEFNESSRVFFSLSYPTPVFVYIWWEFLPLSMSNLKACATCRL